MASWRFPAEQCPKSLQLLVKLYRFIGFSFSGTVFVNLLKNDSAIATFEERHLLTNRLWHSIQRITALALNISAIVLFIWSLVVMQKNVRTNISNDKPNFQNNVFIASYYFDNMLEELKPILRYIVQSLAYVHLIDSIVVYSYNLIFGNEMIRVLCKVPSIQRTIDTDYSIAVKLLVSQVIALFGVTIIVLILFNNSFLNVLYQFAFAHHFTFNDEQLNELKALLSIAGMHVTNYVAISVTSLIFIYTMIVFYRYIRTLQCLIGQGAPLDETSLLEIKSELALLSKHFRRTLQYHSVPITSNMAANIVVITGATCFVIINQDKHPVYVSFIFAFALFDLTRMVAVCWAADFPINQYDKFTLAIFERVEQWNLTTFLRYGEICEMRQKFQVTIGGTYVLEQSAILTILCFALNMIFVLLQTETSIDREMPTMN